MPESYRFFLALSAAVIAFSVVYYLVNRPSKPQSVVSSFSLEETISGIKRELQKLEDTPGQTLGLILNDVKIALFVQEEFADSGDVSLTVPVFDEAKLNTSDTLGAQTGSKVTVDLAPPRGSQVLSASGDGRIEFADLLVATREALQRSMQNEPKLEAKSIEVELAFVLTAKRTDSASVKAKVVSIGISSEHKGTSSNTITLIYSNPKYQTKDQYEAVTPP